MDSNYQTTSLPYRGNAFFSIEQTSTTEIASGNSYVRHVVRHPGGVGVVALQDRFAVCVRQYRPAIEQRILEIPAGRPEPGEHAEQTARRELFEETSLVAGQLRELASFYNAPCFCDGMTRLFVGTGLKPGDSSVHDGEFPTSVVLVDLMDVERLIYEGLLVDAKTIIALQLARARLEEYR